MDRRRIIFAAAAAVVVAVALVLVLGGGEEDVSQRPATTVETTEAPTRQSPPQRDDRSGGGRPDRRSGGSAGEPPPEVLTSGPRRDVARTVAGLVQAVELGDGEAFCRLLGRRPGRAKGVAALRQCGRQARIDPFSLPTSDELVVREVEVRGASAVARLGGGRTVMLQRSGGRWLIRSFAGSTR